MPSESRFEIKSTSSGEVGKITIIGARGKVEDIDSLLDKVKAISSRENNQMSAQLFNARMVFGADHLLSAAEHAFRSFDQGRNTSNGLPTEILLYASGELQIHTAIKKMGIDQDTEEFVLVLIGEWSHDDISSLLSSIGLERDDRVLEPDPAPSALERFGILPDEMETVSREKVKDLMLEKVALRDVLK